MLNNYQLKLDKRMLMRLIQNMSPLKITLFWEATFKWIILYPLMLFSQLIIGIITYNSFHSYYEVGTMENTLHRLIYSPPYPLEVDRCTIREVKSSNTPGMDLTLFFFFLRGSGEQAAVNCPLWCLTASSPCLRSLPVPLLLSRLRCPHLLWCGSDGGR